MTAVRDEHRQVLMSEHERDALTVARRVVMWAQRHGYDWSEGAATCEPLAVVINLDCLAEKYDDAESEVAR
jgi:hypothetical protein